MSSYRHTQPGKLLRWIFGIGVISTGIGVVFTAASAPSAAVILGSALAIFCVTLILFHSLTVELDQSELAISFGPGLIRKKFPLAEIVSAKAVTNRWFYGWGIRYTSHGWLYNVSGWGAVEIQLRNGRKYRIGTDEPGKLTDAISSAVDPDES